MDGAGSVVEVDVRSRERLIEVLRSVNPNAIGTIAAGRMKGLLVDGLLGQQHIDREFAVDLAVSFSGHPSPHIRELAAEALHYLTEEATVQ